MGFASFMILIWDHVDTFVSEVRDVRYALKLLFTKGRRLSTYGKDGKDPVSTIPTFPAILSYDHPQSPVVYLFLIVGGREFQPRWHS